MTTPAKTAIPTPSMATERASTSVSPATRATRARACRARLAGRVALLHRSRARASEHRGHRLGRSVRDQAFPSERLRHPVRLPIGTNAFVAGA
jgi:hypothetical protein